jgi:hypothetical protein
MTTMPRRRSELTLSELGDESVIFDPSTNTAHKLAPTALAVWQECDGSSTVDQVGERLSLPAADVEAACAELVEAGLANANGFSRRRVLQGGAVAGALLVSSVVIPQAAAAASLHGPGQSGPPGTTTPVSFNLFSAYNVGGVTPAESVFTLMQKTGPNSYSTLPSTVYTLVSSPPGTGTATAFHGSDQNTYDASDYLPSMFTITGGPLNSGTLSFPSNVFGFHPGPHDAAVVKITNTFSSPVAVTVSGSVTSRDSGGGVTGIVFLDSSGAALSTQVVTAGTGVTVPFTVTVPTVAAGDSIYAVLDKAPTFGANATQLDLTASFS